MMRPSISASPLSTRVFHLGENLLNFITEHLPIKDFPERSVLAVTSKIVSLAERAVLPREEITSKIDLVRRESDRYLATGIYGTALTIKHGILIPSAGIDESNSEDAGYILFPKDPYASARELYRGLQSHYSLREFGLIITDSHTHPLRRGVTGIGLSHWGFRATRKLIGREDLFGRPLTMTYVNTLDALSVAAVFVMGEADESTPLALVQCANLEFSADTDPAEIQIPENEDLYGPILRGE